MKKNGFIFLSAFFIAQSVSALAEESPKKEADLWSPKNTLFVVETDEDSAKESLNRIAGEYDRGFATPDQAYESEGQSRGGPFARQSY